MYRKFSFSIQYSFPCGWMRSFMLRRESLGVEKVEEVAAEVESFYHGPVIRLISG